MLTRNAQLWVQKKALTLVYSFAGPQCIYSTLSALTIEVEVGRNRSRARLNSRLRLINLF